MISLFIMRSVNLIWKAKVAPQDSVQMMKSGRDRNGFPNSIVYTSYNFDECSIPN